MKTKASIFLFSDRFRIYTTARNINGHVIMERMTHSMKSKKLIAVLLIAVLCLGVLAGCSKKDDSGTTPPDTSNNTSTDTGDNNGSDSNGTPDGSAETDPSTEGKYRYIIAEVSGVTDNTINYTLCKEVSGGTEINYTSYDPWELNVTSEQGSFTVEETMSSSIFVYDGSAWNPIPVNEVATGDRIIITYELGTDVFVGIMVYRAVSA